MAVIILFFKLGVAQQLTLDNLKQNQTALKEYSETHFGRCIAVYFFSYVLMAALSLPGATVLTLAGGAFFGLLWGTLIVSFASTIGATGSFLFSRFLLRDSVQARFSDKLQKINEGVRNEGAFYLFTLRLVPAFPFFLVNLLMGLTPMKVGTYFIVSQIGMLPGTLAYINAGTELAQIESFKQVLSPSLLLSFVFLGLLPIVAKKIVNTLRSRKQTHA